LDIVRIRPIAETVWAVFFVIKNEFLTIMERSQLFLVRYQSESPDMVYFKSLNKFKAV
jgi:hypothetical protein